MGDIQRWGLDGALDNGGVYVTHADHEQAVEQARAEGFAAGERAGIEKARELVEDERLEDTELPLRDSRLSATGRAADRAYNRALDDVLAALDSQAPASLVDGDGKEKGQ